MAKSSSAKHGRSLVIVESPAKARTISRFLGPGYTVEASLGHIRDLPAGRKEVPEDLKDEEWAYLGVNVESDFTPVYVIPEGKRKQVSKLRQLLRESDSLYLATDEDREGEAISWHLFEVLNPKVAVHRLVFHEITEEAIQEALAHPRQIDNGLVQAQETRRILDRLYGYDVSQLLWKKVKAGLSAGRVQSVAVRLIVEREEERMAFVEATYWDILGTFANAEAQTFQAQLASVGGRRLPGGKDDFDSTTGALKNPELLLLDGPAAEQLLERLREAEFRVTGIEDKPFTSSPRPPFTTSTLQQEANNRLGFTARRTMSVAQSLYENGYITYMRTDSTSLAQVAIDAARDLIRSQYGEAYLPSQPRIYKSKVKNAQEAHEAIRPAGHPFQVPDSLRGRLSDDEFRLFDLIWKRTIASQMVDARGRSVTLTLEGGEPAEQRAAFTATGRTLEFPGYRRAYAEGAEDPDAQLAEQETLLPPVTEGERVDCRNLEPKSHTTQPPPRFTEATLTRTLEERGIGRPSTYAAIIDTILARKYVFKKGKALVPTWVAFSVTKLMREFFPKLVDYDFTAQMEDDLDSISRGEAGHIDFLRAFYSGKPNGGDSASGLKQQLEENLARIDARAMSRFPLGTPADGEHREEIAVRVGRYGPFLEQGERKASIPEDIPPDELTLELALEMLAKAQVAEEPLGVDPETGRHVYVKSGRHGPYVQLAAREEVKKEKPKNASLLDGMDPAEIDLETALRLLALPLTLGADPKSQEPVLAHNGPYGPYVSCGEERRSLPEGMSPFDVTLEKALELLAQPKSFRRQAKKSEPIKVFDPSPVTGEPIRLLEGRFGPYVTDGVTNASLPKGRNPAECTHDEALQLLADRAARAPSPPRGKKKKGTKTAKKKAPPKRKKTTAKKKTTKKKKS